MVPNVVGLVIVPSVLVVNELYISWKEKQRCLDTDTGSRYKMIMLSFAFDNSECQGFSCHTVSLFLSNWIGWLMSRLWGQEVRVCILRRVSGCARRQNRKSGMKWMKRNVDFRAIVLKINALTLPTRDVTIFISKWKIAKMTFKFKGGDSPRV